MGKTVIIIGGSPLLDAKIAVDSILKLKDIPVVVKASHLNEGVLTEPGNDVIKVTHKLKDLFRDLIKSNKIRCQRCGSVIESLYTLHSVRCSCGNCMIDGGTTSLIRDCSVPFKELSEYHIK